MDVRTARQRFRAQSIRRQNYSILKVASSAEAVDEAVREHPDQAIVIPVGVGVGVLIAYLLACRRSRNCD
jgi:ElaB/YqjD/DUF883 family membrane-anchored ribosome-binding protein